MVVVEAAFACELQQVFGVGVGEGVSSESLEGGGGKRIGGLEGAESQEEVYRVNWWWW